MNKHLILVVDDEPYIVDKLKKSLERTGHYEVMTAHNGVEALDLVKKHQHFFTGNDIQCLVTDIKMPEMDGLTCAKEIRAMERFSHLPIVLLSAYEDAEKWQKAVGDQTTAQVTAYLVKDEEGGIQKIVEYVNRIVLQKQNDQISEETREVKFAERLSVISKKNRAKRSRD